LVKRIILKLSFLLISSQYFFSEDINLFAVCDNNNIVAGEFFQINLNITGANNNIELKDIIKSDNDIMIRKSAEMSSVSIINGVMTTSKVFIFMVNIPKSGNYEIGPFILNINGNEYKSNVISLNASQESTSSANQTNYKENKNNSYSMDDNYFILESQNSKNEIYSSEYLDVSTLFYVSNRADLYKNYKYKPLNFPENAWIEGTEDSSPKASIVFKNNLKYYENKFESKRIFIYKPGTYTIYPATMNFIGIIPVDFMSSEQREYSLSTKPIVIKVNPLPANPPQGFDGAVGYFKMHSSLSPINVKGKNPISLKIILEGEGNFHNLKEIGYDVDSSLEIFSSKSTIESKDKKYKTKILEVLLIPSESGKFKIKTNNFSYFDINKKQYVTLKGSEYNINVTGIQKNEKTSNSNTSNDDNTAVNSIKEKNINTIGYINLKLGYKNSFFKINSWFLIFISTYILIIVSLLLLFIYKYILYNNILYANIFNKKKALNIFNKNIKSVFSKCKNKTNAECIDKISIIMEKYFIDKFNIDSVEFTNASIKEKLGRHLCHENINKLKSIISELDIIRFGGSEITEKDIIDIINKIKIFIQTVDIESSKKSSSANNRN
jgi:hypothetical protein